LLNEIGSGYESLFRKIDDKTGEQLSFFSKLGKGDIKKFTDDYLKRYNGSKDYGYISIITCNHDTPRMSRNFDENELKLAYAFIFTMPGMPFLYYGDEIGMSYIEGLISKEGGYSRTGTRTPMQWNSNKNFGFSTADPDKLYLPVDQKKDAPTVDSQAVRKDSLLQTVKEIIKLRLDNESLQADCVFEVLYAESEKYPFIYKRGEFIIGVNPSVSAVSAPVGITNGDIVYSIGEKASLDSDAILMAPQSFVVIKTVK
jgi:maltose alpha-D-glucosyltransferase/alpha-amylase